MRKGGERLRKVRTEIMKGMRRLLGYICVYYLGCVMVLKPYIYMSKLVKLYTFYIDSLLYIKFGLKKNKN